MENITKVKNRKEQKYFRYKVGVYFSSLATRNKISIWIGLHLIRKKTAAKAYKTYIQTPLKHSITIIYHFVSANILASICSAVWWRYFAVEYQEDINGSGKLALGRCIWNGRHLCFVKAAQSKGAFFWTGSWHVKKMGNVY